MVLVNTQDAVHAVRTGVIVLLIIVVHLALMLEAIVAIVSLILFPSVQMTGWRVVELVHAMLPVRHVLTIRTVFLNFKQTVILVVEHVVIGRPRALGVVQPTMPVVIVSVMVVYVRLSLTAGNLLPIIPVKMIINILMEMIGI